MPDQLKFELVSPEALIFSKPVALVTVPGSEGDFGVLPGHSPLIATVRPGVIDVYEQSEGALSERIFVAGGFAEVTAERCTVLAEEAIPVAQLDRASVQKTATDLTEKAARANTSSERAEIEVQLAIAQAKLQAMAA